MKLLFLPHRFRIIFAILTPNHLIQYYIENYSCPSKERLIKWKTKKKVFTRSHYKSTNISWKFTFSLEVKIVFLKNI